MDVLYVTYLLQETKEIFDLLLEKSRWTRK